ncbi:PAS domain-containing sensor histidine kinase [[Clostridium] dakarense]|uniref:PAS domain-containing sensor histidine kinase n=1 Tax=Faecalimicrobium dakarense TaxID=1301100 RepID=UPI0004AEE2C4|nr:ATP-binding protein [[Clostridium] dakarense]
MTKCYDYSQYTKEILDKLNILLWVKDKKGRYRVTNLCFDNYGKINSEDIIGKTDFEIFPTDIATNFNVSDQKILNKELDKISTLTFINDRCYNASLYPIYDKNKEIIGTIGLCIDMNESQSANDEAQVQKKMLELISDNIPDHIFFKDSNGIFKHCNENFAKVYKCTKEEIIGKSEDEISIKNDENYIRYKEEDAKVCSTKRKIISEGVELLRDGSKVYTETIKVPFIDENGMVGGVLGICRDISHRKEAEVEFERLRMEFFANLSHEFRTPLNLIFSSIQLLDIKLEQCKDCEENYHSIKGYEKYINIIRQNGYRLLKLVNNLIDSTRLDVGSVEYSPKNYDIVNYVENIFDSVVKFANQNSINMIFDTMVEEHIVAFDLDKMERIILNLISNAIKFNKRNGIIEVNINCDDKFVEIEVKDTGIGIPNDKLGEVFEKFKQANNRMTKVNEGSGIGLSLVKSLVDLHNGKIEVESEIGEYTKFTVKIPNVLVKEDIYINDENHSSKYIENIQVEFSDIYLNLNN